MKAQLKFIVTTAVTVTSFAVFATPRAALAEPAARRNASALLDEAKKAEYERKIAAKQLEMNRLADDQKKGTAEMEKLDQGVQKIGAAWDDSAKELEHLTMKKRRSAGELELLNLRIDAERLKGEGLRMLQGANRKALDAVSKHNEETDARAALVAAETRLLAAKSPEVSDASGPGKTSKNEPTMTELRKKLARAERASSTADSLAREAMISAGARVQQSDAAAAKAEKKQAELGEETPPTAKVR